MAGRDLPQINTSPFDATQFFRRIVTDREGAFGQIQGQVPLEGPATPRAQALIDAGEWDAGDKVALLCLRSDRCQGVVASTSSDGRTPLRFCGRKTTECTYLTHKSTQWSDFQPGWYIPAGNAAKFGFFQDPHLPLQPAGGPISLTIGRALSDTTHPFKLTVGQWKFVIETWWDARVVALHDSMSPASSAETKEGDFETPREEPIQNLGTFGSGLDDEAFDGQVDAELASLTSSVDPPESAKSSSGSEDPRTQKLEETVEGLAEEMEALIEKMTILTRDLHKERVEHVKTRAAVKKLKDSSGPPFRAQDPREIQEVARRVGILEGQAGQAHQTMRSVITTTSRLEDVLTDPVGEFQGVKESVDRLEKQLNVGGGVEAHGARFSNPSEIPGWLGSTPNALALFHDAVTVLHCIGAPSVTHKDTLAMMKAQRDVKITSDLEAKVVTSFRTKLPAILYGSASTTDDEYIKLATKLKAYKDWHCDDGVSGVSQKITADGGIHEVRRRVGQMTKHSTTLTQVLRLSDGLMSDSIHFIQRFVLFIDTWVLDLRGGTFFSETQVWEIMVTTIETVFDELRGARAPMQDVADDDRRMLLWGILKAHEVMRRFLKHDFINDPAISGILIQKMIRQSPTATSGARLSTVEKNLNAVSSKVVALSTRMSNAEGRLPAKQ